MYREVSRKRSTQFSRHDASDLGSACRVEQSWGSGGLGTVVSARGARHRSYRHPQASSREMKGAMVPGELVMPPHVTSRRLPDGPVIRASAPPPLPPHSLGELGADAARHAGVPTPVRELVDARLHLGLGAPGVSSSSLPSRYELATYSVSMNSWSSAWRQSRLL